MSNDWSQFNNIPSNQREEKDKPKTETKKPSGAEHSQYNEPYPQR